MKNIKHTLSKSTLLLGLLFITASCEREYSDQVEFATNPKNGVVFLDAFPGDLSYLPFQGSLLNAFSVDNDNKYKGSASMRYDVPNVGDPNGAYAGAIFRLASARDLTEFDALTFWAKGTKAGLINEIGFGQDFLENKYQVTTSLRLTTNWRKYVIPIPDATKLLAERGMFWFSEGPENNEGYSFWIDELQFEKLGTLAQPQPKMLNGIDVTEDTFTGTKINLASRGITQTFNTAAGINETVNLSASYFEWKSSNENAAIVSESGIVTVVGSGTATITGILGGIKAAGSLTLNSLGNFQEAPVPTTPSANVISIFSDAYTNVAVDYYNGFFTPDGQTTLGGAPPLTLGSGQVINYTMLNFVGIGTFRDVPAINATDMTHLHVDINVQEVMQSGDILKIQILNSVGNNETSGLVTIPAAQLETNKWKSFDIPLANFTGLSNKSALGLLFFISDNTISNIFVDNIYYYKQ